MIFAIALFLTFVIGSIAGIVSLCWIGLSKGKYVNSEALGSGLALIAFFLLFQSGILVPLKTFIPPNIEGCVDLQAFILATFFSIIALSIIIKGKEFFSFICGMSLFLILISSFIRAILEIYF